MIRAACVLGLGSTARACICRRERELDVGVGLGWARLLGRSKCEPPRDAALTATSSLRATCRLLDSSQLAWWRSGLRKYVKW